LMGTVIDFNRKDNARGLRVHQHEVEMLLCDQPAITQSPDFLRTVHDIGQADLGGHQVGVRRDLSEHGVKRQFCPAQQRLACVIRKGLGKRFGKPLAKLLLLDAPTKLECKRNEESGSDDSTEEKNDFHKRNDNPSYWTRVESTRSPTEREAGSTEGV